MLSSQDFFLETRWIEFHCQHLIDADSFPVEKMGNEEMAPAKVKSQALRGGASQETASIHNEMHARRCVWKLSEPVRFSAQPLRQGEPLQGIVRPGYW